jgi:hypothetical protein
MNKILLKLLLLPAGMWKALGADFYQLKALLEMRIKLDDRRPLSVGRRQNTKTERNHGSWLQAFFALITGVVLSFPLIFVADKIISLSLYFTILLSFLLLSLITDFSNTLFDNRDKLILFSRPIDDRTLVLGKMLHIMIYLMRLVGPMTLPGWIYLAVTDGWGSALLFPFINILLVIFSLFLVNSFYLLVLRLVSAAKFKDVINYFQILTSVAFFFCFYILPNLFQSGNVNARFSPENYRWMRFLPSSWLACNWYWLGYPETRGNAAFWGTLGLITPIICMVILVKWLSPEFSKRISDIDGAESGDTTQNKAISSVRSGKIARIFNRHDEARAGFLLTWLITSRSRTFRMRVYPSFAFIPIYFVYLLMQKGDNIHEVWNKLPQTSAFILLLYLSSYALINGLSYLVISDQYKAAWIYYAAPVDKPGNIMIGAFKAMWVKFFLPFFLLLSVFVLSIWSPAVIVDILLALVNVTLMAVMIAYASFRQLPFSKMEQIKQRGGKVLRSIITMLVPFLLGGLHYLSLPVWWLKPIFLFLSGSLLWLIWDGYAKTTWEHIIKEDNL